MKIGRSYKQHGIPSPGPGGWDAIVVGSGLGGLACAAMLARHAHQRVLVLERHYTAGGFTHTFHRPGYEWDVGVHYVGDVHRPGTLLRRVFDHLTDGELAWADMGEVYDQIVIGDDVYDFVRGREAWRRRMHDYFPRSRDAIDRYLDLVRATVRRSRRFFMEKALPPSVARFVGGALRYPGLRDARRTAGEVINGLTDDPRLRGVLAGQYGDYGLPPGEASWFMHALLVGHYFGGGAYPVGGSSRMAQTILPGIERAGGAVITNADVERIVVEDGRAVGVRLAGGEEIRARSVISDAGLAITAGRLLEPGDARRAQLTAALPDVPPSFSHLALYLGLDKSTAELGLRPPNQWVYPHHDHDRAIAEYRRDPDAPLPVAYLSFPSAKDPDFDNRCPGRATIEVIGVAPYEWFAKWEGSPWKKRGDDYETFKRRLADRLTEQLVRRVPSVAGAIDHSELSTPLSTRHFAGHPHGEIYGLSHNPARFEQRGLRPHTGVRGLFLTGADICTAGVGGALMGGILTAAALTRKNLLTAVLRGDSTPARRAA
ncbi:MAG: NAD(P)/FAD-dependent oxidoreductase [Kofleriaceae bacterium]|nr:NAD(P)/FAD-dependent oxidoreductase [Myxococcales bacterium]MCB9573043.1 NAD(P)/FAD-dependent oxidoreductase [Kofleriaceae bacterium]